MADIDEQMNALLGAIRSSVPKGEAQERITYEGAKVMDKHIAQAARSEHYNDAKMHNRKRSKERTTKHLADSTMVFKGDIDGIHNGTSTAAFANARKSGIDHGRVARFLNDGTVKIKADHFVDRAREKAKPEAYSAIKAAYEKEMDHDDG
ncbi:hypothetical protein M3M38_07435 [Fructilactobacillus cliffordii]|uniref:hypothetical protein n=1 Tax=Fructilactobacillus cliffordii TaxID=2940299 RepID=UPI0020929BA6|nr:hypothetical protein [Fructilactobacillus cliffordii]USS86492.1 hypothetical protein M3M38_07435 [Fructilactobacillus cliffordii]